MGSSPRLPGPHGKEEDDDECFELDTYPHHALQIFSACLDCRAWCFEGVLRDTCLRGHTIHEVQDSHGDLP